MKPLVSVIVPVYNAEKHLRQCMDSIVNQTLQDIEIICVDDGSTDDSFSILQGYQAADSRIKCFRQENQYAGVARNHGMEHAVGKYLIFWDSDDYYDATALTKMVSLMEKENSDVCVCGANRFLEDLQEEVPFRGYMNPSHLPEIAPFSIMTNMSHILNFTNEAPWNKMFLASYIRENHLSFQPCRNGNDVFFIINALCHARRISTIEEPLVCYRKNQETGLVSTVSKAPTAVVQAWKDTRDKLIADDVYPEKSFLNKMIGVLRYQFGNMETYAAHTELFEYIRTNILPWFENWKPEWALTAERNVFLGHMMQDDFHEFLSYYLHDAYIQRNNVQSIQETVRKKLRVEKKARQELDKALTVYKKNTAILQDTADELFVQVKKYRGMVGHIDSK